MEMGNMRKFFIFSISLLLLTSSRLPAQLPGDLYSIKFEGDFEADFRSLAIPASGSGTTKEKPRGISAVPHILQAYYLVRVRATDEVGHAAESASIVIKVIPGMSGLMLN